MCDVSCVIYHVSCSITTREQELCSLLWYNTVTIWKCRHRMYTMRVHAELTQVSHAYACDCITLITSCVPAVTRPSCDMLHPCISAYTSRLVPLLPPSLPLAHLPLDIPHLHTRTPLRRHTSSHRWHVIACIHVIERVATMV